MKFRIAICDDEQDILNTIKKYITSLSLSGNIDYKIETFTSGKALIDAHQKDAFDIILLDIELETENGIEIAKQLRCIPTPYSYSTYIVFVTSYPEYMHDSFDVQAFQFLQKPIDYVQIEALLKTIQNHYMNSSSVKIHIQTGTEQYNIPLSELIYIRYMKEKKGYAEYVLSSQTLIGKANMNEIESKYSGHGLISPCRGYIVNIRHASSLRNNKLTMKTHETIDISRRKLPHIQEAFSSCILSNIL